MGAKEREKIRVARAIRDLIINATEQELRSDLEGATEGFDELAARGQGVVMRALGGSGPKGQVVVDLHRGLGALIRLLRRRDQMSVEKLAEAARVDIGELQTLEADPTVDPHPRTIYQLASHFKLPPKALVVLSGAVSVRDDVRDEVVRFAASSTSINTLSREEKKLLNQFVRFLCKRADG